MERSLECREYYAIDLYRIDVEANDIVVIIFGLEMEICK